MLRNFIVLTCLFTAVLSGQVLKPAAVSEPADYEFIVLAGESIELSVEQKEGFKYEWNDGGAGKLEPILGTGKARWTAPNTPGKENPVNIKILAVSERNIAAEKNTIVKKVAVCLRLGWGRCIILSERVGQASKPSRPSSSMSWSATFTL